MHIDPYINFNGRCDEAIKFYESALDAKVELLLRFKDAPTGVPTDPNAADKVMHARLKVGTASLLVSDGRCMGSTKFEGIHLSLSVDSDEEAKQKFDALADGGTITMPLTTTFFASSFGMVNDRFGVSWMVMAER